MPELVAADAFSAEELAALFTAAFDGYWLPVSLDAAALAAMVKTSDIDLAASRVLTVDGAPAGLALLGLRGAEGWIAGMGVVPAERRRGHGRTLIRAALNEARRRGAHDVRLEVLDQNEAAARRTTREPWQRADGTIAAMRRGDAPPEALAVGAGGKRDGAVVFRVAGGRAAVLQLAGDEKPRATCSPASSGARGRSHG